MLLLKFEYNICLKIKTLLICYKKRIFFHLVFEEAQENLEIKLELKKDKDVKLKCSEKLAYACSKQLWGVFDVFLAIRGKVKSRIFFVKAFVLTYDINYIVLTQHLSQIGLLNWNVIALLRFINLFKFLIEAL